MSTVSERGRIFDIQRFCLQDGPGIRTTVFFKGCPLHCAWCHNPESWERAPELLYRATACVGCGACAAVCPTGAHRMGNGHALDRALCTNCGACADACPTGALETCGSEMTASEVLATVLRDRAFYREEGGMTVSGGEPFLQKDFLLALLQAAKAEGIHTAVETSGATSAAALLVAAEHTDLFLYDCKLAPGETHLRFTGVDGVQLHENLRLLDAHGAKSILRCPIIPTVNDNAAHFAYIAELAASLSNVTAVHVQPYHATGLSKAESLGREDVFAPTVDARAFKERIRTELMPLLGDLRIPVSLL